MIDSFHNVDINFYAQFAGNNLKAGVYTCANYKGENINIPVYYAKKSNDGLVEASAESYPKLSIQNYAPKLNKALFFDNAKKRFAEELTDEGFVTGNLYTDFFPMEFNYDVSIATKRESEWDALKMHFARTFFPSVNDCLKFNRVSFADGSEIYDPVGYKVESIDIPRSDGTFETNFAFKIFPWVQLVLPVGVNIADVEFIFNNDNTDDVPPTGGSVGAGGSGVGLIVVSS